ncbi:hypothetical protein RND81_07G129100 [Saponaria officinalis]|uniref:Uncharacterized protein n=1 Tax=Saponaria officinalis TaxID=3572 RepID=A0AAW1JMW7_SAPOF
MRQRHKTLSATLADAEQLVDYHGEREPSQKKGLFKGNGNTSGRNGGPGSQVGSTSSASRFRPGGDQSKIWGQSNANSSYSSKGSNSEVSTTRKPFACFLCKGPHRDSECLLQGEFNAIKKNLSKISMESDHERNENNGDRCPDEGSSEQEEQATMGAVHMMCLTEKEADNTIHKTPALMYVGVTIMGRSARAMVDTGATHNFVNPEEAKRLGLKFDRESGRIKADNSSAKPIYGVARNVSIKMGDWSGQLNFTTVPINNFKLVLEMDFLKRTSTLSMPHLQSLMMMGSKPCLVKVVEPVEDKKKKGPLISAMQLKKGLKRVEPTYLCSMSMKEDIEDVLKEPKVKRLLMDFQDMMPDKLPETLLPRRSVDHQIELIPGAKPPARGAYRLAPPELAEFRSN